MLNGSGNQGLKNNLSILQIIQLKRGWDKSPSLFWIVEQDAVVEWALLR